MQRTDGAAGPVRFGLIGCGDIGRLRAAAVAKSARAKLTAVSDLDPSRSTRIGNKYGAVADREWRTLLQRHDVDAVIVSTPPALHEEMCVEAMAAGKDVLCEKPLARSPAEGRRIVDAAHRNGRFLATGFNYRFYPSFVAARETLASGAIGELDHIRSYGGYSATGHNQPLVHDADVVGGGALSDIGIHLIDLTRDFLGDVAEVSGFATNRVWGWEGCEDNGFALLRSSEGRIASVHASWTEWRKYQFRIELYGSHGCITATCFPMMTRVTMLDKPGGHAKSKTQWFARTAFGEKLRSYRWVVIRSFVQEFEAFAEAVAGQPSRIATGADGLRALEIAAMATRGGHATTGDGPQLRLVDPRASGSAP
jgi:predicted dehydrogenase